VYCNQCEQTSRGVACVTSGVCGKKPEVSALQDILLYSLKGLSLATLAAKQKSVQINPQNDHFLIEALFSTLTNVNFDAERFQNYIGHTIELTNDLIERSGLSDISFININPQSDISDLIAQGENLGALVDQQQPEDIRSLQETLIYALKGVAAYAYHAYILGQKDQQIYDFAYEVLAEINNADKDLNDWLGLVLKCGEINILAMQLLDEANTSAYGHPVPTSVPLGHIKGKAILVSGHDLHDLHGLLKATEGTGINIYTHGEMLPAHGYPELKKYPHFYGHYGTAWQNQRKEFVQFPGPIFMTTNCLQEPVDSYKASIFTTGPVGWPGVTHLGYDEYEPLIAKALEIEGFTDNTEAGSVMVGFARNAVLSVADQIISAVKAGDIKHFLLVGGCDGARSGRNYFTEIVEQSPQDTVIMTLGCGKYRFFDQQLGSIGEIPRLLDVGQCNDAYSAVQIALALADAFECGVNDLPLSLVLSWYEQKAVAVLLSLLYLGIKDIRLGPTLPAFISPGVLNVLVENFSIKPITTAQQDLAVIMA